MTDWLHLAREERDVLTKGSRSSVPVLIVDDNPSKRLALKAILVPLGHTVVEADSGMAALRCVMAQNFAVILLDVRMDGMDGFETASLIRLRWQSEMTPIIFITAHGADELVNSDRYAEGAVDFMFAPVAPEELRAKVSVFANLFLKAESLAARALEVQTTATQLRLLTDAAPIGIFQTDTENRYVYTNPRWSELTGISADVATGMAWDAIIDPSQRRGLPASASIADAAEVSHRFEIRAPTLAAPRWVLMTSKAMHEADGRVTGWVGTLADVTAEAGAESAMTAARDAANVASRLKSDFLANMSHEIRTPMNGVIGMTDLLLETDLDARQRDYAETVRSSGEALLTIINDILDFSKIEAGKLEVERSQFDLRSMLDDVVDLLAGSAQAKGLELIAVVSNDVPGVVGGDPGRVRQVLTNLIGNAIKFTQAGEIVVRVSQDATLPAGTGIRFEVADTGDGIASDKLGLIFQPFAQADTSTSRRYGGTGLGLAISSQLVALLGGACGVSSEPGVGSTFWFTIAVDVPSDGARWIPWAADPDLVGFNVLLVDDSATQRDVLTVSLAECGMTVRTADSAESALATMRTAAIHGRPFDLAVVDHVMPGMDGVELAAAITADRTLDARVVLMTGLGQESTFGGPDSGIAAALSKPVRSAALRSCLRVARGLDLASALDLDVSPLPSLVPAPDSLRVLLAEDNPVNQKVAIAMLASAGYSVDAVTNGAQAVAAAAARPYAVVLMDCQMPELNGYEATAMIRSNEGSTRHTPIIALTAGARQEDRERCFASGMDGYLAKPVSKDALLDVVAHAVRPVPLAGTPEIQALQDGRPVLDLEVIGRLQRLGSQSGEDLVARLAVLFLADECSATGALRLLYVDGDRDALARAAHALSGASANLGAADLACLCDVVAAGSVRTEEGLSQAVEDLEAELDRVRTAVVAMASTS